MISQYQVDISSYTCSDNLDYDRPHNEVARLDFTASTKRNTSQATPDFKMLNRHIKGFSLYQAEVKYFIPKPDPNNPGSYMKQSVFEYQYMYENVDFEYDNQDLILKTPQDNTLPACQIRFKNDGKVGEHKCEFEKSDVGYRAATFNISCSREGKVGTFTQPDL